jgi:uncharacterized protein
MSPEERQLLSGLFDRTRNAATTPRDPEAEALVADQVKAQPYAPYFLAQAVIVQQEALKAANEKLQALEAHVRELEQRQPQSGAAAPAGGFLSGLGSLFGSGGQPPQPPRGPAPGPWQQPPQGYGQQNPPQGYGQQNYEPPPGAGPGGSPWGAAAPGAPGGGFLKGALGAAAGVAGGVLLADSIRGLFGGHNNALGIGSGAGGIGSGLGGTNPGAGGETVVNNYYESNQSDDDGYKSADYDDDRDSANDDSDSNNDDGSYDV